MMGVKGWAFTVCCTSFLLSIVHSGASAKKTQSVIKLVAGLYILTVMATPLLSFDNFTLPAVSEAYILNDNDIEHEVMQMVQNQFLQNAGNAAQQALWDSGFAGASAQVHGGYSGTGAMQIESVHASIQQSDATSAACAVLKNVLGADVKIVINGEEQ